MPLRGKHFIYVVPCRMASAAVFHRGWLHRPRREVCGESRPSWKVRQSTVIRKWIFWWLFQRFFFILFFVCFCGFVLSFFFIFFWNLYIYIEFFNFSSGFWWHCDELILFFRAICTWKTSFKILVVQLFFKIGRHLAALYIFIHLKAASKKNVTKFHLFKALHVNC